MPYFPSHNILLIHIPKTGGSSIENILQKDSAKYLYTPYNRNNFFPENKFRLYSLQHQFYSTIFKYRKLCRIKFDDKLRVISVVRNPYDRLISALLFHGLINRYSTPQHVFKALKYFIFSPTYVFDNHNAPQYKFITDENLKVYDNVKIFHTENLNSEMKEYGIDLNAHALSSGLKSYSRFWCNKSIYLVNRTYRRDFEIFGYKMKETDFEPKKTS